MTDREQETGKTENKGRYFGTVLVFILICAFAGVIGGFLYWTLSDLPHLNALEEYVPAESSKIYSADGKVIAEFYYERRTFVPTYRIPDHVKKAFVAIEDARFYSHPGIDFIGTARALYYDIRARGMVQGGSTITQQLAKMLFLKPEKSLMRKIREAVLSIQIERRYTKDEILGLYLNQTYFGTRAFGVEAASQTYFGKSVSSLTVGEAALLASLPKAPSLYSPFRNPEKAAVRRGIVLNSMLKNKFITSDQFKRALAENMPAAPHYRKYEAPYFLEMLRQQMEHRYGNAIYTSGYKIYSSLDFQMQKIAEAALDRGVKELEKRVGPGVQAAFIAIDYRTGHIKAMIGGFDFWANQFNRATQALRQPGSAFKPFVYAAAFEEGMGPADIINDSPVSFKGARQGETWSPKNYDGRYYGPVTMKTALAKSLNAATVRLAARIGIDTIIGTARKIGIRSELQPYMPLALGASDVTLIDMATAYAVLASGRKPELISYERIQNRDGIFIEEVLPKSEDALGDEVVAKLRILLEAVIKEGTGTRAKEIGRPVFGKTGTTNDYTDAWFLGFDEKLVAGVWVGRDNHKPLGKKETGATAALPVWIEFMKKTGAAGQ